MASRGWLWGVRLRVPTRRYRRVLIAALTTFAISTTLLGLIVVVQRQGRRALQSDTHSLVSQLGQQLIRALSSRRGTLTFLKDALARSPLSPAQLRALGASAVKHTRHLHGIGLIEEGGVPVWWAEPNGLSRSSRAQLNRTVAQRARLHGVWRVPATFSVTLETRQTLLVMLEPLQRSRSPRSAVVGVFDFAPLLHDFFATFAPTHPVQLLDGDILLYRSPHWTQPSSTTVSDLPEGSPKTAAELIEGHQVALDAARWTIQMQPGRTRVAQTLSRFNLLLIGLSLTAGLGLTMLVWLLAARTWILQRAVTRRTAALRRVSERLRQMATTDELTGLHNRRFFLERWEREWHRAKRYRRPLACLMIDVNRFKQVNDRLGHQTGDLILQRVAQELKAALRQSDLLARFGGDEFVAALPETGLAEATVVAEKLRRIRVELPAGPQKELSPVNLSVGVGELREADEQAQQLLEAADASLYAWKRREDPLVDPAPQG
ncbi:MAG: GGDEF domain-containing protein [Candidatus Omnitrophota bacterium]|nr:GGDEF domain-containing protein [Candidatus Omnitrophota bacterium]